MCFFFCSYFALLFRPKFVSSAVQTYDVSAVVQVALDSTDVAAVHRNSAIPSRITSCGRWLTMARALDERK